MIHLQVRNVLMLEIVARMTKRYLTAGAIRRSTLEVQNIGAGNDSASPQVPVVVAEHGNSAMYIYPKIAQIEW